MLRATLVSCFALFPLLAGCVFTDAPATDSSDATWQRPTVEELVANYSPKNVTFWHVTLKDTVLEPLGDNVSPTNFRANGYFEIDHVNGTVISNSPAATWIYEEGDRVVFADYTLKSDKHNVSYQIIAISSASNSVLINIGGFNMRFLGHLPDVSLLWFGAFSEGTYGRTLIDTPDGPQLSGQIILHDGVLPVMLDEPGPPVHEYIHKPIESNFTFTYWGPTPIHLAQETLDHMAERPDAYRKAMQRYEDAGYFVPGMRHGQLMHTCDIYLMKAFDPCMTPFTWPDF